jgi:hypothetical protein
MFELDWASAYEERNLWQSTMKFKPLTPLG